jgi:hypothetical protein
LEGFRRLIANRDSDKLSQNAPLGANSFSSLCECWWTGIPGDDGVCRIELYLNALVSILPSPPLRPWDKEAPMH